jgi:hypothetical protein
MVTELLLLPPCSMCLQVIAASEGTLSAPSGALLLQLAKLLDAHPSLQQMMRENPAVRCCADVCTVQLGPVEVCSPRFVCCTVAGVTTLRAGLFKGDTPANHSLSQEEALNTLLIPAAVTTVAACRLCWSRYK